VSRPEVMQRDLRSRSREIMDSVEHGQSFTVTWGTATAPGNWSRGAAAGSSSRGGVHRCVAQRAAVKGMVVPLAVSARGPGAHFGGGFSGQPSWASARGP